MATSRFEIARWMARGRREGATHLIVMVDSFNHEDYPVFVPKERNFWEIYRENNSKPMQQPMEVYDLSKRFSEQLDQARCWNVPPKPKFIPHPMGGLAVGCLMFAKEKIQASEEDLLDEQPPKNRCLASGVPELYPISCEYYRIIDRIANGE